jgi:hypothetical protein
MKGLALNGSFILSGGQKYNSAWLNISFNRYESKGLNLYFSAFSFLNHSKGLNVATDPIEPLPFMPAINIVSRTTMK